MSGGSDASFRAAGDVALIEQFENHDGWRPPASAALAGTELSFVLADGAGEVEVSFGADGLASWRAAEEGSDGVPYEALEIRPGILALTVRPRDLLSVFAVLCLDQGRALAAVTELEPDGEGSVNERTRYLQAGIGGPLAEPFETTEELVGKRIHWRYSETHAFEHVYLNPGAYCWHCIEGPERGIADVDPCVYHRLGAGLYLFSWSETSVPNNCALVIDLEARLSAGRFFGWDTELQVPGQLVVGARGTLLNETTHEGL